MTSLLVALITTLGGIGIAGATYWFTKKRERDAELRKEKLEHYKAFVIALSGTISGESTPAGQGAFACACNNLNLIAPQIVIERLRAFQEEIKTTNPNKSQRKHDELMSQLFLSMRRDLGIDDDESTFAVGLWASGNKTSPRTGR
ncbi:MAG: hypothetical protein EPO08_16445 [Rhodospirillaceae bacterium]|nr:MAG: hypothetical protein EPO08_16445 [Rhodospirillaceae bacterium]